MLTDTVYKKAHEEYIKQGAIIFKDKLDDYIVGERTFEIPRYLGRRKDLGIGGNIGGINGRIESLKPDDIIQLNISTIEYTFTIKLPEKELVENISNIIYMQCDVVSITNGRLVIDPPNYGSSEAANQTKTFIFKVHYPYHPNPYINFRQADSDTTKISMFTFEWSYLDSDKNILSMDFPHPYEKQNELFIRWMKIVWHLVFEKSVDPDFLWKSVRDLKNEMIIDPIQVG